MKRRLRKMQSCILVNFGEKRKKLSPFCQRVGTSHFSYFQLFCYFFFLLENVAGKKKRPNKKKKKGRKKNRTICLFSWVNVFQRDFLSSYSKQTHRRHLKETDGQTRQLKVLSLYFSISPFFFFVFLFLGFVLKFLLVSFFLISSSS